MARVYPANTALITHGTVGTPPPWVQQAIQTQFHQYQHLVPQMPMLQQIIDQTQSIIDNMHGEGFRRMYNWARNSVSQWAGSDVISTRVTVEELRCAPVVMQQYIMAMPELRQRYHLGQIDGYSDTYTDGAPGTIGLHHVDYQAVMDGVLVEQNGMYTATSYVGLEDDGGQRLLLSEKDAILSTWDAIRVMAKDKGFANLHDFTDIYAD